MIQQSEEFLAQLNRILNRSSTSTSNLRHYPTLFLRYGGAKKSTFEVNDVELEQAAQSILRWAKETAFSKRFPIYFSKDTKLMVEFPDGREEEVKRP